MEHGEHIFVWSRRRTVSSCKISILRSPDHYNRRMVYKQVWAGLECMPSLHACAMRRRPDIQHNNNIIFSYKFKIVNKGKAINNRKTKPMVETMTAQYMHDIELHITE